MTPKDKYKRLAERLYSSTIERAIDWKYDAQLGVYARISEQLVGLSDSRNDEDQPLEVVTIRSSQWDALDEFNDEAFWGQGPEDFPQFGSYYQMMSATRTNAYRQAVGADEAIDAVLRGLGEFDL